MGVGDEVWWELCGDLWGCFEAFGAYCGAHGGDDVRWVCAECGHGVDGVGGDVGDGSSPSGVDGGYGVGVWVVEYDGYAVGGVDEEWCAWEVGDECVGVGERGYVVGVGDCGDVGGVGLVGYDELLEGYVEVSGEEGA